MIKHHFSDGMYAKEAFIPSGQILVQHRHKFDHLSILAVGSVELAVDGVVTVLHAPACLTLKANTHHGVKSLTDVVWYCIHATDCTDEENIDDVLILNVHVKEARQLATCLKEN